MCVRTGVGPKVVIIGIEGVHAGMKMGPTVVVVVRIESLIESLVTGVLLLVKPVPMNIRKAMVGAVRGSCITVVIGTLGW